MSPAVETKQDYAYRAMKELIVSRSLLPGQRIIVNRIAEDIGTSAIPVREALVRLEAERLVTTQPHIGAVVALITKDSVLELLETLTVLEGYATRLAHRHAAAFLDNLNEHNRAMREAIDHKDRAAYSKANRAFHAVIYRSSGNEILVATIEMLWRQLDDFLGTLAFNLIPDRPTGSIMEHDQLAALLADSEVDASDIESLAREHGLRTVRHFRDSA